MRARSGIANPKGPTAPIKRSRVSVLDADPSLARGVDAEARAVLRRYAIAEAVELPVGLHNPNDLFEPSGLLGLLVCGGLIIREVLVMDRRCAELVSQGAILRPWDDFGDAAPMPFTVRWRVREPAKIAVLDRRFLSLMRHHPALVESLLQRSAERVHTLAFIVAIHSMRQVRSRLLMLLWHYADRFGVVTGSGVHVPLALSHADLAELVGTARPSVSLTLRDLADAGDVWRLPDRTWMLRHRPPEDLRDVRRKAARPPNGSVPPAEPTSIYQRPGSGESARV